MKEIGIRLKEAREKIGITLDEASEDIKVDIKELEKLEAGEIEIFNDIFYLKQFVSDYAKYLGMDKDDVMDDFNEYLFDYTSKLSLDDIKKEVKTKKEKDNKIKSPYTVEKKNDKAFLIASYIAIGILLVIIIFILVSILTDKEEIEEDIIKVGGIYDIA